MIERNLSCLGPHGFHRLAYYEWPGPKDAPTLICVHGLTRNARDFDVPAAALSTHYRVICPDMPGRGNSEWLEHGADYDNPLYLADLAALLARLDVERVDWIGTSMGGIIGMLLAAQPGAPIRRMVINDVGPVVPKDGLQRIADYVGLDPKFADLAGLETMLRFVHAPFGPMNDEQWAKMAAQSSRRLPDGRYALHYDPKIAVPFKAIAGKDIEFWEQWDKIACPVLLLRGARSDILRRSDAEAMTQRGPRARLIEFPGIGHAPTLMGDDQLAEIRDFLFA